MLVLWQGSKDILCLRLTADFADLLWACACRWLGHGTVAILTLHGWGYWALWLWEGIYPRGLYWDPYGSNMLSGGLAWFAGALLWVTSLSYVRRNFFEVGVHWRKQLRASAHMTLHLQGTMRFASG